jgi:hypothetical protein
MRKTKKYAAFLSFAHPDKELVMCLKNLFRQLDKEVYFSLQELPKANKSKEWRKTIIDSIRNSSCFITIYTPHSLKREWVLYESGIADAFKIQRLPARVSSVLPSEIEDLPNPGAFVYDLSDKDSLANLITKVCVIVGEEESSYALEVLNVVHNSPLAERIYHLSRTRWVFIAGNYPDNAALPTSGLNWFTTREDYLDRLKKFCKMLTETLLREGFSVSACPQVEVVGMHVISEAVAFLDDVAGQHPMHVDFSIGGIHPIDREARNSSLSDTAKRKWIDHIMGFRKSYLSNQEWLILIGGNEGTKEEYAAAKASKIKIMTIPCFGGISATIHSKATFKLKGPCAHCIKRDGTCDHNDIMNIVLALKGISSEI